jgi:NADH:ubiquinone oxidoreductase subunit 4 (subunit M)
MVSNYDGHWLWIVLVATDEVVVFYTLFEGLLLLMYGVLIQWCYSTRASYSLYMLVGYTLLGSGLMVLAFVVQYTTLGIHATSHAVANTG